MNRSIAVLHALIEEYVDSATPVASKTLVQHHQFDVSSATIRNDLSKLEVKGFLIQPHVSAGRIPTDLGYRSYVDHAIDSGFVPNFNFISTGATSKRDALLQIADSLSQITKCFAMVGDLSEQTRAVARINLVPLPNNACCLVVILDDGSCQSKTIQAPGIDAPALQAVEAYLNDIFVGRDIMDIQSCSVFDAGSLDAFAAKLISQVQLSVFAAHDNVQVSSGVSVLFEHPEFQDVETMRQTVDVLEDDSFDIGASNAFNADGLYVSIGGENDDARLRKVSIVAKEFICNNKMGFVACVGPTRMDYNKTIGAVRAAARQAQSILAP